MEVTEVEAGLGQEAADQAGLVLHPPEPGLDQRGQLIETLLGEVGQRSFKLDQTPSPGFSSGAYAGSWKTVSNDRAAICWRIARLVWVGRLSQTRTIAPPSS